MPSLAARAATCSGPRPAAAAHDAGAEREPGESELGVVEGLDRLGEGAERLVDGESRVPVRGEGDSGRGGGEEGEARAEPAGGDAVDAEGDGRRGKVQQRAGGVCERLAREERAVLACRGAGDDRKTGGRGRAGRGEPLARRPERLEKQEVDAGLGERRGVERVETGELGLGRDEVGTPAVFDRSDGAGHEEAGAGRGRLPREGDGVSRGVPRGAARGASAASGRCPR